MSVDLKTVFKMSLQTSKKPSRSSAPNKCSFALIAGKYLNQVDAVLKKIDNIGGQVDKVPEAAFVFTAPNQKIHFLPESRNSHSPAMVKYFILFFSINVSA